jgi:Sporulation and spore germination
MTGRRAAVLAGLLAALVSACGVPTGGAPETIPPSAVPYGLASSAPSAPAATSSPVSLDEPRVYLVGEGDALVPRARDTTGDGVRERLESLLAALAEGPTRGERGDGLATALPPRARLTVADLDGGTATIDITGSDAAPSGKESRRAVGQIVLTATSLPDVTAVLLVQGRTPVEAPLPSGELTTAPLTAADYAALQTPSPAATPAPQS